MKLDAFYQLTGGDYAEALSRFQNDARILRFLKMFPSDGSMLELTAAMQAGDARTAFRAVHTLKGISLNLGLGSLAAACSALTEALRGSDTLPGDPALYGTVAAEYTRVREALDQLEE